MEGREGSNRNSNVPAGGQRSAGLREPDGGREGGTSRAKKNDD